MVYGDNQTKHFYVVTGSAGVAKKALAGTDKFRLNIHEGGNAAGTASNVTATTDIFDKNLIKDVRVSTPKGIATRTWTINIQGNPVANTTYRLYFYIEDLYGFGVQDRWDRVASYKATSTTASDLYKGLAKDIKNKLYGDRYKIGPIADDFEFYVTTSGSDVAVDSSSFDAATATGIKIVEKTVTPTEIQVLNSNGTYDDVVWGSVTPASGVTIKNGKLTADFEYFHMGERGDQYRMVGWPDYVPTTYIVDPTWQYGYDTVAIHYAYVGANHSVQKSEKDITFIVPRASTDSTASQVGALASSLLAAIEAANPVYTKSQVYSKAEADAKFEPKA